METRSKHSRCDMFFSTVLGFKIQAWQWVCEAANRTFYRCSNGAGECDLWKIYPFDVPQDALFSPWRAVFKECTLTIYLHCGASPLKGVSFMWTSVLLCPQLCVTLARLLSNMTWDDWARSWPSPEPGTAGASPGASSWETRRSTFQVPGWKSLRFTLFNWFDFNKHQHFGVFLSWDIELSFFFMYKSLLKVNYYWAS